jgi:uncharacterized protein with FMN-binding domain
MLQSGQTGKIMTLKTFRKLLLSCTILMAGTTGLVQAAGTTTPTQAGAPAAVVDASQPVLHDGSFIGNIYDAYYGVVQVQATIKNGQLADVKTLKFPNHSGESRSINRQALPMLQQEVVQAQTARVRIISGATLTSRAYIASLKDALILAGN